MSIGSLEEEFARAHEAAPFSDATDGDIWMAHWCERCAVDEREGFCPLRDVAYMGRTPRAWVTLGIHGLDPRQGPYQCTEWIPD